MNGELDLWRLAAGLGLFLFGMHQLEQALTQLAGRSFKKFLRQYTAKPLKGVIAGAVSTAALQSSSVVSLIVLAFVGTGIISLASAIGIVFGSNLGTTMTGWIVATIGFKLDIEALALPLVAIGGFGVVWSAKETWRAAISHFIVGLGLMLMGLEFMKSGALVVTELFDPHALAGYPLIVFLAAGLLLTAIIQSSSATIMITLSALYAAAIPLTSAAAIAIGADLGTTITALLGALAGSVAKKRVAAALILFNVTVDAIAFIFLKPLLAFITDVIGISDPLFALVAFHSLFNLLGILMFLPGIGILSNRLDRMFADDEETLLRHIKPSDAPVPEAAIESITRETYRLIDQAAALNQISFGLPPDYTFYDSADDRSGVGVFQKEPDYDECYADLKQLEGEILKHALALQSAPLEPPESEQLGQIIPAIRSGVHSAKSIKDTHQDLRLWRIADMPNLQFETLVEIKNKSEALYRRMHKRIYKEVSRGELSEVEISTLLNVNRELYASHQSLLSALADALLDMESASDFESIPAMR